MLGLFGSEYGIPDNPFDTGIRPPDIRQKNLDDAMKVVSEINNANYDNSRSSTFHVDFQGVGFILPDNENQSANFPKEGTDENQNLSNGSFPTRMHDSVQRMIHINYESLIIIPPETKTKIQENRSQHKFHIPIIFNNFKSIKLLGKGAYGIAILVEDQTKHLQYVAKFLSKLDYEQNGEKKELEVLSLFNHENIIKVFEAFRIKVGSEEYYVTIMEYCPKGNFYDIASKFKSFLTQENLYRIFYQILIAVRYVHSLGFSHGDIKPENILFDEDFNVKLCDFGFSKSISESTEGKKKGTINFAAPELFCTDPYDILLSDIWSIGITFYQMKYRKFPYNESEAIPYQIVKGKLNLDPNDEFQKFISKFTQGDPQKRAKIDELIHDNIYNCIF